ncbi:YebC-related [Striga asiatica]|uniref:YebC-related n=1 Tax=Striga asiatica TaxID=4170 RepID=A0A5A7RFZ1_STRAF|nr:YebC-related [Striga asiatica]
MNRRELGKHDHSAIFFWNSGSIMFKFRRARVVNINAKNVDKDKLLAIALDSGADDVIDPLIDEDGMEEDLERHYKVVSSLENYTDVLSKLREEGITFETDNGFELLSLSPIEVDDEAMDLNKELMAKLLELDDVDAVYTDQNYIVIVLSYKYLFAEGKSPMPLSKVARALRPGRQLSACDARNTAQATGNGQVPRLAHKNFTRNHKL